MFFDSPDHILDFAISQENQAYEFYLDIASQNKNTHLECIFSALAEQEKMHKEKLLSLKETGHSFTPHPIEANLKIPEGGNEVYDDFKHALFFAMKKENDAAIMYSYLSKISSNPQHKKMFNELAEEEKKHKSILDEELKNLSLPA